MSSHFLRRYRPSLPVALLALAVIAYAVGFSVLTIVRYAAFEARALDMGNLNQAIWNTAHGNWFHLTNQPGTVNRLSLHVEPILLPIAALYRLYPAPPLLLALQAVVVALGALPLFALARHQLKNAWAGLAFALVYLLNPTIQAANWLEFHPVTLAPTLILAAFYAIVRERPGQFAFYAVLAASCKEEIGLLVAMLGAYVWIIRRRPRWGLLTATLAAGWAFFAVLGIQHFFADGNIHWSRYGYLGDSPGAMVWSLLTRPDLVWAQLVAADAGGYLWALLWPTALLALLAPEVLLLALPSLAINLLADFPPMHEVHTLIYAAPALPFALAAAVMGAARLLRLLPRRAQSAAPWVIAAVVLLLGGVDQRLHGYLPGSGNYMALTVTDHHRRAAAILAQIPPDAAVSAQDRLNPHVSGRETVYIFPRVEDADTVLLDVTGPAWPLHPSDLRAQVDTLLAQGFGIAAADDGYLLLRRGVAQQALPPSFFTAWQRPAAAPRADFQVRFGEGAAALTLLDAQVATDRYGELVTTLTWQSAAPPADDLRFYIAYLAPDGAALHDSEFYPPTAVLWYPTSQWTARVPVAVQTLPWTLDADRFTLAVGVYAGERWAEGARLPITQQTPAIPPLEGGTLARLGAYTRDGRGGWQPVDMAATPPALPLTARFGDAVQLTGADWGRPAAESLRLTLHWQARGPVDFDYAIFAHLLDAQGNRVAQLDWQPQDALGKLPMRLWEPGWPVVDTQELPLPADLPAGEYTLWVGLYDWQTGARLPVVAGSPVEQDALLISTIRLEAPRR